MLRPDPEMIKVERPSLAPGGCVDWVSTDKGRHRVTRTATPSRWLVDAMRDDRVGYFTAPWSSIAGWIILERVEQQEW